MWLVEQLLHEVIYDKRVFETFYPLRLWPNPYRSLQNLTDYWYKKSILLEFSDDQNYTLGWKFNLKLQF